MSEMTAVLQRTDALERSSRIIREWIRASLSPSGAAFHRGGAVSLMPTCFAILAAECVGGVLDGRDTEKLAETLRAQQDEATGFFIPGILRRGDFPTYSATYLRMQATYFAIHALDALDSRPLHPVRLADVLCDQRYLRGWLDAGPWSNPWRHSNSIMFALTFLERAYDNTGSQDALSALDSILDYLDERQDEATGLWQPDDDPDLPNAVFAAYHFFPYYFWRGRRPNHVERIIDSVLAIQQADGLFVLGGGACEDLDAVHTLVMMSQVSDHRPDAVRKSLERCYWRLLALQNVDGGFPNRVPTPGRSWKRRLIEHLEPIPFLPREMRRRIRARRVWKYSGWEHLSCPVRASDTWSAWFRPLSLKLISERYPDVFPRWEGGAYRRIPGLGWHSASHVDRAAEATATMGRPAPAEPRPSAVRSLAEPRV